jgi:acyl-CoA thioester hydrolase
MSAPAAAHVVHRLAMEVRWRDLDAFNHVNNAAYHGYVEEARVRWFRALSEDWANETAAPILAAVTMNYRRAIGWPESLIVELLAERVGTKSVTLGHRIVSAADPDRVYADGNTVLVWVDRSGATLPLPDAVRSACGG